MEEENKNIGGTKRVSREGEAELAEKRASMSIVGRGTGKASRQGVGKTKKVLKTERERERKRTKEETK